MTSPERLIESGLSHYLDRAHKFPMLEPSEEYTLAKRWREHGDVNAAHQLITSHLRFVAKIAMGFRGYGLPLSEIVSEGNIGLMQAVKRFDPDRGFRLATYAMWWIKASIRDFVLRSWSLVRIGTNAGQRKLFFKLRAMRSRMSALGDGDLHDGQVKQISKSLRVPERDVIEMAPRLRGDLSLNAPMHDDGDVELQDRLVDDAESPESVLACGEEAQHRLAALRDALPQLKPRERRIFEARRLQEDPVTLDALSVEFGVSRERVRQIEVRAFEKMQKAVKANLARRDAPLRSQKEDGRLSELPLQPSPSRLRPSSEPPTRRATARRPLARSASRTGSHVSRKAGGHRQSLPTCVAPVFDQRGA